MSHQTKDSIEQESANYCPQAKSHLPLAFVNKVDGKRPCPFIHLRLLSSYKGSAKQLRQRPYSLQSLQQAFTEKRLLTPVYETYERFLRKPFYWALPLIVSNPNPVSTILQSYFSHGTSEPWRRRNILLETETVSFWLDFLLLLSSFSTFLLES